MTVRERERDRAGPTGGGKWTQQVGPARVPSLHYTSFFKDGDALSLLAPLVLAESSPTSLLVICASPVALFGACCCGVLCFLGIWIIGDLGF